MPALDMIEDCLCFLNTTVRHQPTVSQVRL
jgi:hypothetical protein